MISFLDLIIARVIWENRESPPSQRELLTPKGKGESTGLVNAYLSSHAIPSSFTPHLTSNQRLTTAIKRLRSAGLIQPSGAYAPTDELTSVWEIIGHEWATWPIEVPVQKNRLVWEHAEYKRKVRGYRKEGSIEQ